MGSLPVYWLNYLDSLLYLIDFNFVCFPRLGWIEDNIGNGGGGFGGTWRKKEEW